MHSSGSKPKKEIATPGKAHENEGAVNSFTSYIKHKQPQFGDMFTADYAVFGPSQVTTKHLTLQG